MVSYEIIKYLISYDIKNGPAGEVRTHDLVIPNHARYHSALQPDKN